MNRIPVATVLLVVCAARLWAFNPPVDSQAGVSLRIEGVPEAVERGGGLTFRVVCENTRPEAVTGTLHIALNDDWRVIGAAKVRVAVAGEGATSHTFSAEARDTVLAAHYPVHAEARLQCGDEDIVLHPIAIFVVTQSKAAGAAEKRFGLEGGVFSCLSAAGPITIDGDLGEWGNAVSAPCGAEQLSTGELPPESFQASFHALHDGVTLFLGVNVADDDISCRDRNTPDFMHSDYVRLYLSAADPEMRVDTDLGADDVILAVNVAGAADGRPLVRSVNYGIPGRKVDLGTCRFASARTATGYTLEASIPLSQIGDRLGAGSALGANVMIGDADAGRRRGEATLGDRSGQYWLTPQSFFRLVLESGTEAGARAGALPPLVRLERRSYRLDTILYSQAGYEHGGESHLFPTNWQGTDKRTGCSFAPGSHVRGGVRRKTFSVHPPWRSGLGGGAVWRQYNVEFPEADEISLEVNVAIRDHRPPAEPPSDGVEFRVFVSAEGGAEQELLRRFTDSKTWVAQRVDLSAFVGQRVLLKLWTGPGPEGNTVCDSGYWGDAVLHVGRRIEPTTDAEWQARTEEAVALAREGLAGGTGPRRFRLAGRCGTFGAGIAAGKRGLVDSVIAFSDGSRDLAFRGFVMEVGGQGVGEPTSDAVLDRAQVTAKRDSLCISHRLLHGEDRWRVDATFSVEQGALVLEFSMPRTRRNARGEPRLTRLGLGPASSELHRVYLGFGNVVETPNAFSVRGGGFGLSTRHVGCDYAQSLSLVQACDIFPDQVVCQPQHNVYRLETRLDATYRFIPSADGAFAAARHYRDLAGFKPGRGMPDLLGRMCLDQWGGDYGEAAEGLHLAAKYGLTHSVFVKHAWQRWGYDYRLPEIYPPRGGLETFRAMPEACREHGILFAPHDNYIDFYPDAEGFSYDHIIFNADGTPQRAWFNKGRKAQSYRWLPHAFLPWLKDNMRAMRKGFAPTSLFIDVFSAIPVVDYYDRTGRFHPRTQTAAEWAEAFDVSRKLLKRGAPMLSECGHDALIGSLDGGQADHHAANRWGAHGTAACRTPWHDMATHGAFVLFAGGLGHRYGDKDPAHTYGTDDYLSNTVIGGRNPMCDGPFSRRAVMTYWLLHDVCDTLARASLESHRFGASVYQQHTVFGDDSQVWTNRAPAPWRVKDRVLPEYGFLVRSPQQTATVCEINGQRAAFASSPGVMFVDARPSARSLQSRKVRARVVSGDYVGDGTFKVAVEWTSTKTLKSGAVPFVHVCHPTASHAESIAFHGNCSLSKDALLTPTTLSSVITIDVPAEEDGTRTYTVRYGLFNPSTGGNRIVPAGNTEGSRMRGGKLQVTTQNGKVIEGAYIAEAPGDDLPGLNRNGTMVDFGPVLTNGAFRLYHPDTGVWRLIPLPGSFPFEAQFRLGEFGVTPAQVNATRIEPETADAKQPNVSLTDGVLSLAADGRSFAYEIVLQ